MGQRLSAGGLKVVSLIIQLRDKKLISLPCEVSLQYLEERTGVRAQSIGMAYDDYIKKNLENNDIISEKCGTPRILKLSNKS